MVGALATFARPAAALTIVPPSLEFPADPGQKITTKVKLFNEESTPIAVFSSTANFTAKDEQGDPDFTFQDTPTDLASWIQVGAGPFTLASGDRVEIPVTIQVPTNAEPGGHYASLFFGTDPSLKPENGGQVSIRSLIGTLVILRVSGQVTEQASLKTFAVNGKTTTFSHGPVNFDVRVQNSGNVHVRPSGSLLIKNMWGRTVATVPLNSTEGAVLPNSIRKFSVTWGEAAASKGFFGQVAAEWHHFNLGMYSAELDGAYGSTKKSLSGSVTFLMFPWHLLLIEAIVVLILLFVLIFGIKRYNSMIIHRAQGSQFPKARP